MSRIWYLGIGGHPVGPLASDEVAERVRESQADGETLVWREGMAGWRPLAGSELASLLGSQVETPQVEAPVPAAPAEPKLATVTAIASKQEAAPTDASPRAPVRYGGFWRRAIALTIDCLLTTVLSAALTVFVALELGLYYSGSDYAFHAVIETMHGLSPLIALFIYVVYFGAVQGVRGATFGKWLCGLRVERPDGRPIGVPRALFRSIAWAFSGLAAGSGYLIAGVHPRKRSWHDIVSGTVVVQLVSDLSSSGQSQSVRPEASPASRAA